MQLPIPSLLVRLVEEGRWPATAEQATKQNLESLVPPAAVAGFAPEEELIFLHAPPFRTAATRLAGGEEFWSWETSDPGGIDPEQALVVGDFGLGSDAQIVLDYRTGSPPPRVIRLRWARGRRNKWVEIAPSFEKFVALMGI